MPCYIHVRVEPGAQIFCRVYGNYINVANPNSANRHFSCLLVPITRNSVLSSFNINLSLVIHERTSAMHFSIASSASASHVLSSGRNDKCNWVSSAYECADGRWDLIILKSLLADFVFWFFIFMKNHILWPPGRAKKTPQDGTWKQWNPSKILRNKRNKGNAAIYFRGHEGHKRNVGKRDTGDTRDTEDTRHKRTQKDTRGHKRHRGTRDTGRHKGTQ